MQLQLFTLIALALLPLAALVDAGSVSLPLRRRVTSLNEGSKTRRSTRLVSSSSLQAELQRTRVKYGIGKDRRRSTGTVSLQEESGDASYYAPMTIGGSSYNIILDTGSAVSHARSFILFRAVVTPFVAFLIRPSRSLTSRCPAGSGRRRVQLLQLRLLNSTIQPVYLLHSRLDGHRLLYHIRNWFG